MAALDFLGSGNNYARGGTPETVAAPFTMLCWVLLDDVATFQTFWFMGASGNSTNYWRVSCNASGAMQMGRDDGAGAANCQASGAMSAGVWYHAAARFTAADNVEIIRNASFGGAGSSAISRTPAGTNRVSFGRTDNSAAASPLNGRIGDAAIFASALSNAAIAAHQAGRPAGRIDSSLAHWWPMWLDLGGVVRDVCGGVDLTIGSALSASTDRAPGLRWPGGGASSRRRRHVVIS